MSKVLVIGDGCTDVFVYGKCERLSPEAPVPIFKPTKTEYNGGMSINVFQNLKALGVDCKLLTNDIRPVKTRHVDIISNQMLLRVDENDVITPITANTIQSLILDDYDAIMISDYNKGYLSETDIEYIAENHPLVFLDTKKKIGNWAKNINFIKINEKEYIENWSTDFELWFNGKLIVTKGKDGAVYNYRETFPIENKIEIRDLSGAGDTFFAGLVAEYIKNNDISNAIRFANRCASWVVSQKGVVVIKPELEHQLMATRNSIIVEVSTTDFPEDSIRLEKGD